MGNNVCSLKKECAFTRLLLYARCISEEHPHTVEIATIEHIINIATFVNIIFSFLSFKGGVC